MADMNEPPSSGFVKKEEANDDVKKHLYMGPIKVPKADDALGKGLSSQMDTGIEKDTVSFDNINTLSMATPSGVGQGTGMGASALGLGSSSSTGVIDMLAGERGEMSDEAKVALKKHQDMVSMFDMRKKARNLPVPTQDVDVRKTLRSLGQPITLFGEGAFERRERLRLLMAKPVEEVDEILQAAVSRGAPVTEAMEASESTTLSSEQKVELFYTEGTEDLRQARLDIAKFSLPRACMRLQGESAYNVTVDILEYEDQVREYLTHMKGMGVVMSQVGDDRPLTCCRFSPDSKMLATSSWGNSVKIWNVPKGEQSKVFRGHTDRVNHLAWRDADETEGDASVHLLSCGADCTVKCWNVKTSKCVGTLTGHEDRVNQVAVHPSGRYVAASSHDHTWRLWDLTTQTELLVQEGHSKPVYAMKFHPDGSIILTGDLGGVVRVWDLRTGKAIIALQGHVKQVLGLDINPHAGCHILASCSDDNTVRIWDLRRRKCTNTVLAHTKLVSDCLFEPLDGRYLMTSGFDGVVKLWSSLDYSCTQTLQGELNSKVMSADVSENGKMISAVFFDRTWKLWLNDNDNEGDEKDVAMR
eukprot:GHVN01027958.1.p1 GENE.GHVN01027958.1~~GHVN01027958.1.p1  ORF type:complete len:585 (-),score=106.39 GHVN01027958.1:478-2232(-)